MLGIDPHAQDTEPGITAFPFTGQRAANLEYFLANDLDAVLADTLTLGDLPVDAHILPAVGQTSPHDGFDDLAAQALAVHLGVPAHRFPGGHNGNLTHPRAFAQRVRDLLAGPDVTATGTARARASAHMAPQAPQAPPGREVASGRVHEHHGTDQGGEDDRDGDQEERVGPAVERAPGIRGAGEETASCP